MLNINKTQKIYFIGIGGIMMSAVAKYFKALDKDVLGSDRDQTEITADLASAEIIVYNEHQATHIDKSIDLVVYTQAIPQDNPELNQAKKLKIPALTVYELLGQISKNKSTIAITGMHGKSTTTSMLGLILANAKIDPTVFIGTKIKEWDSNFRFGKSEYILSEACEYKDNFLNYHPQTLVINNIEAEHLDYFKNLSGVKKSFTKLISQLKPKGNLIINIDNDNIKSIIKKHPGKLITFGIDNKADFQAIDIKAKPGFTSFKINSAYEKYNNKTIKLKIPGEYNVYNALAAISVASTLDIKFSTIKKVLEDFEGSWRRFEYKGEKKGIQIYDDYAHHPTELKALLSAAHQKWPKKKIWFVFQPHLYSRTHQFLDDFAEVLNQVENIIITDIYAAREINKWEIEGDDLTEAINKNERTNPALHMSDFNKITDYLRHNAKSGNIIFTLGAGEAYKIGDNLLK